MLYLADHLITFLLQCKYLTEIHPEPKSRTLGIFLKCGGKKNKSQGTGQN